VNGSRFGVESPRDTDSMPPANAALEVTPSRLSKTIPLAEAAVASADSDKDAPAHVATNVRNRMRFPHRTAPRSSLLLARLGGARSRQREVAKAGGRGAAEAWQACRSKDDSEGARNNEEAGFRRSFCCAL
jgi:hypothetical protein